MSGRIKKRLSRVRKAFFLCDLLQPGTVCVRRKQVFWMKGYPMQEFVFSNHRIAFLKLGFHKSGTP
jgi:hypothetical protein